MIKPPVTPEPAASQDTLIITVAAAAAVVGPA